MVKTQSLVTAIPIIGLLFLFTLVGFSLSKPSVTHAACSISSGNTGHWFGGFFDTTPNYTLSTRAVKADIWNYNPGPIFDDTSIWVMITEDGTSDYGQIGWGKDSGDSVEYVFAEYTDGGSGFRAFYDAPNDEWIGTKTTQPPSSKLYTATWVDASPDNQLQFIYDGSAIWTASVDWIADTWDVSSEVRSYEAVAGTDKGDHSAGGTSNKIKAHGIKIYGASGAGWADPSGYSSSFEANMSSDTTSVTGVGYRIWDNRCSE